MRVIKLTHGAGNGIDKACLMTATSMLNGNPEELDECSCVCPVIRQFIIKTNDAMPEELLPQLYGDLPWEIMGTRTDDLEMMRARGFHFADVAVRQLAPIGLEVVGLNKEAAVLRGVMAITDKESADTAANAAAYAAAYAADAAADAARAAYAARAARATVDGIWQICRQAIIDACKIGDRRPVEAVMTCNELCTALAGSQSWTG